MIFSEMRFLSFFVVRTSRFSVFSVRAFAKQGSLFFPRQSQTRKNISTSPTTKQMDRWREVVADSNVWYSTRELYDAIALCIANRSTERVTVEVDTRRSDNMEVFAPLSPSSSLSPATEAGVLRVGVPALTTMCCATFKAATVGYPTKLVLQCSVIELPEILPPPAGVSNAVANTSAQGKASSIDHLEAESVSRYATIDSQKREEALQQSETVGHWLRQRRSRDSRSHQ